MTAWIVAAVAALVSVGTFVGWRRHLDRVDADVRDRAVAAAADVPVDGALARQLALDPGLYGGLWLARFMVGVVVPCWPVAVSFGALAVAAVAVVIGQAA